MSEQTLFRNIPNLISALRILLLPVFVLQCRQATHDEVTGEASDGARLAAMAILITIGVSDVIDGFLARRMGWVTPLGKVLDPLADKLAQVTGLVLFTVFAEAPFERIPAVLLVVILFRDVVLLVGSTMISRQRKLEVVPGVVGKAATFATFGLLILVTGGLLPGIVEALTFVAAALVVASGIRYVAQGWRQWTAPG